MEKDISRKQWTEVGVAIMIAGQIDFKRKKLSSKEEISLAKRCNSHKYLFS